MPGTARSCREVHVATYTPELPARVPGRSGQADLDEGRRHDGLTTSEREELVGLRGETEFCACAHAVDHLADRTVPCGPVGCSSNSPSGPLEMLQLGRAIRSWRAPGLERLARGCAPFPAGFLKHQVIRFSASGLGSRTPRFGRSVVGASVNRFALECGAAQLGPGAAGAGSARRPSTPPRSLRNSLPRAIGTDGRNR